MAKRRRTNLGNMCRKESKYIPARQTRKFTSEVLLALALPHSSLSSTPLQNRGTISLSCSMMAGATQAAASQKWLVSVILM